MNAPAPDSFATDALEKLRHRLLDLTGRNRLLNFTHGRQGNIRIIDAIPNVLHRKLLSEEELRFQAIPSPTRQELIEAGYIEVDHLLRRRWISGVVREPEQSQGTPDPAPDGAGPDCQGPARLGQRHLPRRHCLHRGGHHPEPSSPRRNSSCAAGAISKAIFVKDLNRRSPLAGDVTRQNENCWRLSHLSLDGSVNCFRS